MSTNISTAIQAKVDAVTLVANEKVAQLLANYDPTTALAITAVLCQAASGGMAQLMERTQAKHGDEDGLPIYMMEALGFVETCGAICHAAAVGLSQFVQADITAEVRSGDEQ